MFVFVEVEGGEVEKAIERRLSDGVQHVEQIQTVRARTGRRVPERPQVVTAAESYRHVRFVGRPAQVEDAIGTDQVGGVGSLAGVDARVVDDSLV